MPHDHFDEPVAAGYDAASADMFEPSVVAAAVDFLAARAEGGAALEFGIGTGRLALPLLRRGVPVTGIDLSSAMVARLRAKPDGDRIPVTIGDIASTNVGDGFQLVYVVFNTITNLTTQDEQVACFCNAARHLEPGGRFVVEVFVPILQRLPPGETVRAYEVGPTRLSFDEYDVVDQTLVSHHYRVVDGELSRHSVPFRYAWPAEFDLMARIAGMTLEARFGGWSGEPFTSESTSHVSVWRR